MIFSAPIKQIDNIFNVDFININNLNIVYHHDKSVSPSKTNCELINSGFTGAIILHNVNGKYAVTSMVYNNNPVFINNNQNIMVGGIGYGSGSDVNKLSEMERSVILDNLEESVSDIYLYRDGPYLLGKFNTDNSWAIIRVPESLFPVDALIDNTEVDLESLNSEEIVDNIVAHQIISQPPTYFKSNNIISNTVNYNNWLTSKTPKSRDWVVSDSYRFYEACYTKNNTSKLNISYGSNKTFNLEEIDRQPELISRSKNLIDSVYDQFLLLKESFLVDAYDSNFKIVPPLLESLKVNWIIGTETNYLDGTITDLGSYNDKKIQRLEIDGDFINAKDTVSIVTNAKYTITSINIYLEDTDDPILLSTKSDIKKSLQILTQNIIENTELNLTNWARNTAFLTPPDIFFTDWYAVARNFTVDTSAIPLTQSKYTNKYYFINYAEALFYSRLFELIKIKGI